MYKAKIKSLFVASAIALASGSIHAGTIIEAPASAELGSSFDVLVKADNLSLGIDEAVVGFAFEIFNLSNVSLTGIAVNPDFDDNSDPGFGYAEGTSFAGVVGDPLDLATLTFSADSLGAGSGDIVGLVSDFLGLLIEDTFTFDQRDADISGSFNTTITNVSTASVPVPGALGLLLLGGLMLRRRKA